MNSHIKDLSGKIAKPAFVEKIIERKKDKRKLNEGEKKIVVIARNGNKFAKKDIFYASNSNEPHSQNWITDEHLLQRSSINDLRWIDQL